MGGSGVEAQGGNRMKKQWHNVIVGWYGAILNAMRPPGAWREPDITKPLGDPPWWYRPKSSDRRSLPVNRPE